MLQHYPKGHQTTMNGVDPRELFPAFYGNPVVSALAPEARWTVSGVIGDLDDEGSTHKAPVDMRQLLYGVDPAGKRLRGAWARDDQCLVTLDEITQNLPAAANVALLVQAASDGIVIIDIEKTCPPEIAARLLAIPGAFYEEESMSGLGYHRVMPLPKNFYDFPPATAKAVLRHPQGWYEILIEHYVTFTRRPITTRPGVAPDTGPNTLEALWEDLAQHAVESSANASSVRTDVVVPELPHRKQIVTQTVNSAWDRLKTLDDFDHDLSRWEFSVLGTLAREMTPRLRMYTRLDNSQYSDSDRAWLLYEAAAIVIPARPKHREMRNGRPYLLDRAAAMIASSA